MWTTRAALAVLAAGQLVPGLWALGWPRHFYATFPGVGSAWVAADGPFNHHLVIDAGAGLAATGVALCIAALRPTPAIRCVALIAYLVHALPHLAYHAANPPAGLSAMEQALTWVPLAAGVALAALLLLHTRAGGQRGVPPPPGNPGRVAGLPRAPRNPLLRVGFVLARRRLGAVPEAWKVTARVPRVALARMAGDAAHARARFVPERVAALASLRAAMLVECAFCVDILAVTAVRAGVRPEQVASLARWAESPAFDEDERVALALADAMTETPAVVDDTLFAAAHERFGGDGVVELAAAIGHENARARTNRVLGVPAQGFAAAEACPLPAPDRP